MKRLGVLILIATLGALTVAAGARAQSITIGQAASDPSATCGADVVAFNTAARSGGPSYVVPAGVWTVSSFSFAGGAGGSLALVVVRATGNPGEYAVVYSSAAQTLTPGVINTFPAAASVQGGDIVGIWGATGTECGVVSGDPADVIAAYLTSSPPLAGTTFTADLAVAIGATPNVAAALSPATSEGQPTRLPPPPPRVAVCTNSPILRGDGTIGTFAEILLSQYGTTDESSPYFRASPAIFVQGYGLMCQISEVVTYGGNPSQFRDTGTKVDGTGVPAPPGLEAVWSAPYPYWVRSGP
jgi:hypothetical protein